MMTLLPVAAAMLRDLLGRLCERSTIAGLVTLYLAHASPELAAQLSTNATDLIGLALVLIPDPKFSAAAQPALAIGDAIVQRLLGELLPRLPLPAAPIPAQPLQPVAEPVQAAAAPVPATIALMLMLLGGGSLVGCAAITAINTGKPLDPVQVQQDLAVARQALGDAGCTVAVLGAVAAPIVAVEVDAQGNTMLAAVDSTGAKLCAIPAPASIASPAGTTLGTVAPPPAAVPTS